MPTYDHARKESDTHRQWQYTLRDEDGNAIDVSGAVGVELYMRAPDGTLAVDGQAATIVDGANGVVGYTFSSSELAQTGGHEAEWAIEHSTGVYEVVPYADNLTVFVADDVQT